MRALWTLWKSMWRRRSVSITSPLSSDAAAAALATDLSSAWSPRAVAGYEPWCVFGSVRSGDVRVRPHRGRSRNSWTSTLEAHFVHTDGGSTLVGSSGTNPVVGLFTALWLSLVGLGWLAALVIGIVNLFAERWSVERGAWTAFGFLSGFLAFGLGLTAIGAWAGRSSDAFLRSWLTERLSGATSARDPRILPRSVVTSVFETAIVRKIRGSSPLRASVPEE